MNILLAFLDDVSDSTVYFVWSRMVKLKNLVTSRALPIQLKNVTFSLHTSKHSVVTVVHLT
jgi:hypothetical protein